jgi:hypothetical protein
MLLKYSLVENQLTERPDDYSAQTHSGSSFDKEAVIFRMLRRGTLLTRTDALAVLNGFEETVVEIHEEGGTVNLPLFNTSFSISGVFEGPMDSFDGNRHKLNINVTKGALLRETEKKVKVEKTNAPAPQPQIQEVKDSISGAFNEKLTAGGVVEIRGYNLKIDGDDPACGLWFVAENGQETKAVVIIENKPSKILAMIPALAGGNYQVKVATQYTLGGKFLKIPKQFVYPKMLVAENKQ